MKDFVLEACVDSVESALAAVKGGANRLELCSNLVIGGTTPSQWLYEEIRKESDIRIHALIRPRFGDFCYTDHEFEIIGILRPDGTLNMEEMEKLMEDAGDMSVTLHRAFDVCRNPYETFEQAKRLGISTILTSGQKNSCVAGKELLRELVAMEKGEITVQIGSGVDAAAIRELQPYTGAHAFHMTGKVVLESSMQYRKEGVNMGLPSLSEFEIFRTDAEKIREARKVLEEL